MPEILFLAQTATDAIPGVTGWTSAGLIGLVLSWLLFVHLPAKDKQTLSLVEAKDKAIRELTDAHDKALEMVIATFRNEIKEERANCRENFKAISESIKNICKEKQ